MEPIRVLIADDHELVRYALHALLEDEPDIEIIGEAVDSQSAVEQCLSAVPDVMLLDMRMPGGGGVEVCRRVKEMRPEIRVLVLTSFDDEEEVFGVLAAGACGYLLKDTRAERVAHAIRAVYDGQSVFDAAVADRIIAGRSAPNAVGDGEALSEREMEVLRLMAQGMSNKEIGHALWIGETTVKTHVSHILRKLGQADRTQAVLTAVREGLVHLEG
jgi:DNA-binding NarL/FixJ family response regulator